MSSAITRFEELALSAPLLRGLQDIGYEKPSLIQAASIPPLLEGHDLLGQAQTGTGKTAAFALPLLHRLDLKQAKPQVLVLTPTRELAIQVAEAFQTYSHYLPGFHVLPIYGGQSMEPQLRRLKRGAHVVVGTPGRVMDHLRRKTLSLKALSTLVLDEADEMLRMGFIDDVEWILEHTPEQRQIALFSATMPKEISRVAHQYLQNPVEVKIKTTTSTVDTIKQCYWQVSGTHKLDALTRILETEEFDASIIFVRTKTATAQLAEKLEARGYACAALNGDISQAMRERTVENLKKKRLDIIVATDVAARGLDVQRITHVINYDIPTDIESYVHRIGRTGRAGRKGTAVLFVAPRENRMLRAIEKATKQPMELLKLPSAQDVTDRRIQQFKKQISETITSAKLDLFNPIIAELQHEQDASLEQIAAALAYLAQRDRPLHAPPKAAKEKTETKDYSRADDSKPKKRKREKAYSEENMLRYRISVGRNHEASPKDIVGAIANEAGIDSQYIGHIKLYREYSTVDLPKDLSKATFQKLKKIRVRQEPLNISLYEGEATSGKSKPKKKPDAKRKNRKRTRKD